MIATLITATLCCAAWFLTGNIQKRWYGALSGIACAGLWMFAGVVAGTWFVVLVALFCIGCFTRLLYSGFLSAMALRRHHAN